jgi:hypothetical protein
MADDQLDEMISTKDGVWKMDVDTFAPRPDGVIKINGVEYPIFSFLDIPIADSIKVARLGDDVDADESYDARMERNIEQIIMLNKPGTPRLTREHFAGMSPRQIIMLTVLATSIAKVPLKPTGSESGAADASPSPSPASVASTGGGETRSSS